MSNKYLMISFRFVIVVLFILSSYYFLSYSLTYIYPLIIAIILATIMNPSVSFLQRRFRIPRGLATFLVIITIFIMLMGTLFIIISELYQGTVYLAEKVPIYFHQFLYFLESIFNTFILPAYEKILSIFLTLNPEQQLTIKDTINNLTNYLSSTGTRLLQDTLEFITKFLSTLPNSVTVLIFIIFAAFLITADWDHLKQQYKKLIPTNINASTSNVANHLKKSFVGFVKAQCILIFISGCLIFIGLYLLQIEHALTIAVFATLVDLIPLIGTGIIFVPWIIYLFLVGNYTLTIGLTILYMIVVVVRQVIEPKVLSSNIGIHPLLALVGYFFGFQLWGVLGIIIAPAILILISVLHQSGIFKWVLNFIKG
ncbi:sporulation integral membrane protein YtvI [Oceanobacillus bengalensis]|uniref:Sporulation integral membrane protein YtvI n=1 Tax=Oceanobacillus bengalensis TaxID=1435466 RepID=A0A494YXR7_9BACI|nr:sporulation integral membrane protein YtvI [Oceanobacillus bengalensis]RKQ14913.1 sporulation integral membrane protein YtvI [Oceanobacillus bengalensis]